ncbi:MAG: hypothetical protein IKG01_14880 [Lachnospiraceae bacterium]|nr:hypothetical protein [Lachnospiraceae bacterium]
MNAQEKLTILKHDLQMLTSANDPYLSFLLDSAEAMIRREGISDDGTADYNAVVIQYAAYLFRKRAGNTTGSGGFAADGGETAMPRFLRYALNNLRFSQGISNGEQS